LVNFLGDGARSANHLARAIDYLVKREARPDASEWLKRDSRFSIEAIEVFQRGYNRSALPKIMCKPLHGRQPYLVFGPTRISVALDLTTHKPVEGARDHIGGINLLFSRGEKSTRARIERCKTIAGLAYVFCGTHLKLLGDADPAICYAVDVYGAQTYTPQGTFSRKLRQIAESCDEIGARWRTVAPPPDYDGPDPD
jgi:hypothetical protein